MTKFLAFALLILAACSHQERNPANIFYQDDRLRVEKNGALAIGTIHRPGDPETLWGTGFQIGACHVLTNYHVISATSEIVEPGLVVFYSDDQDNRLEARLVLSGKPYDIRPPQSSNLEDWALLELTTCRPKERYFKLAAQKPTAEQLVNIKFMGFSDDIGPLRIALDPKCELKANTARGLLHDCATRPGSSGGPLFYQDENYAPVVVGINVSQRSDFRDLINGFSPWIGNAAVPPESYYDEIQNFLEGVPAI